MGQGMTSNSPRKIFNEWNANGLPAGTNEIGKLHAGEDHIGEVGVKWAVATCTIKLDTTALAALDNAASGTATNGAIDFVGAARAAGRGGVIKSVVFADGALQSPNFTLFIFSTIPGTVAAVNGPFGITDSDAVNVVGVVCAGTSTKHQPLVNADKDWVNVIDCGVQVVPVIIPFVCATGTSLYGTIRADAAWDAATADDLDVRLLIEQG